MLEPQNIKPEPISESDIDWFQALFKLCFDRDDTWIEHLGKPKYEAFHLHRQAFILTYTVEDYTDLLTIGVHPDQRRKKVAASLLEWVIVQSPKAQKFFLEVECQNTAAIGLYKKIGFELISIRKGYYTQPSGGPALDAHVMTYQK